MTAGGAKAFPLHWRHRRHFPETLAAELKMIASEIRGDQASAPILLRPICSTLGIGIARRHSVEPGKAYFEWNRENGDGALILLPLERNLTWERFCTAHELGHYALVTRYASNPDTVNEYWKTEVFCDYFARELLLPDSFFSDLDSCDVLRALQQINSIARTADVPWIQVGKKATQLDPARFFLRIEPEGDELKVTATSLPLEKGRRRALNRRIPFSVIARQMLATARAQTGIVQRVVSREDFVGSKLGELFSELAVRAIAVEAYDRSPNIKLAALR